MRLAAAHIAENARAGHFVNIRIDQNSNIIWRRPFSVHNTNARAGTFDILFRVVGRGTRLLKEKRRGETLEILGPLGNTFSFDEQTKEAILVAGGLGIAPFLQLLHQLADSPIKKSLFYGVDTASRFCCLDHLRGAGAELHLATEDGSEGAQGLVTDLLEKYLQTLPETESRCLYVCGPTAMLAGVQSLVDQFNIKAQVSVETVMACGFGACMGCAVPMRHPTAAQQFYLACKDGPVFSLNEIKLDD